MEFTIEEEHLHTISWWRLNTNYFNNRHKYFRKYAFCVVVEDENERKHKSKHIKWLIDYVKENTNHDFRIDKSKLEIDNLFGITGNEFVFNFENCEDANNAWVWCCVICNLLVNQT